MNDISSIWEELHQDGADIVYLVLDGAGGLADPELHKTALAYARTPNLDRIVGNASCGLLETVGPGITPGSGPGHLSLFGYDPLTFRIGRGVLAALGIDFDLQPGDVAARINFATLSDNGNVQDRRAGRISSEENRQLCQKILDQVCIDFDGEYFLQTVAEHRAVLILRGADISGEISDTDPQQTGVPPLAPEALDDAAEPTARLVAGFIEQVLTALADEPNANGILLRGFQQHKPVPSLKDRFGIHGLCLAQYPMYRGVSRLLGMDMAPPPNDLAGMFEALIESMDDAHNFYFVHVKGTDSSGEDGDFYDKVVVIESVDALLPQLLSSKDITLVVTADHSTPARMAAHSWHPVPVLIHAPTARADGISHFDEHNSRNGSLGFRPGLHLMGLALAHAGRLRKFGA